MRVEKGADGSLSPRLVPSWCPMTGRLRPTLQDAVMTLLFEQLLNGLQFGAMLFMLAAGLTLIFGIMGVVNLTHGSFYMVGAYCAAYAIGTTGSFLAGVLAALLGAGCTA